MENALFISGSFRSVQSTSDVVLDILLDAVRQIPDGGSGFGMWFVWLPATLDIKIKQETDTAGRLQKYDTTR